MRASLAIRFMLVVVLAGAVVLAAAQPHALGERDRQLVAETSGELTLVNSREGAAVLEATGLVPGDRRAGSVTLENASGEPTSLLLSQSALRDVAGPNGGTLSERLVLRVSDGAIALYDGPLAAFVATDAGGLEIDERRSFEFAVALPDGGTPPSATTGDNAFQGASTSVRWDWSASSLGPDADPQPAVPSQPGEPAPGAPAPSAPAELTAPADAIPPDGAVLGARRGLAILGHSRRRGLRNTVLRGVRVHASCVDDCMVRTVLLVSRRHLTGSARKACRGLPKAERRLLAARSRATHGCVVTDSRTRMRAGSATIAVRPRRSARAALLDRTSARMRVVALLTDTTGGARAARSLRIARRGR